MTASISAEFLGLQELLAGRYSIERELGRGGMGIVLLARDVALDRPVAIKLLPPHLATRPDERDRFLQEARTAAGLAHPNIVPIHLVEARGDLVFWSEPARSRRAWRRSCCRKWRGRWAPRISAA